MSLSTIRAFLAADTTDSDPNVVLAANPQYFTNISQIPDYAYKSLATIWLLPPAASTCAVLANTILYRRGETAKNATQEMILLSLPEDSYQNSEGFKNNSPGALDYYMEIVYKMPQGQSDFDRLMNTSMRVRYLMDIKWRDKRKARPKWVIVTPPVDLSLEGGMLPEWLGFVSPPNGNEIVERWLVRQEIIVPF